MSSTTTTRNLILLVYARHIATIDINTHQYQQIATNYDITKKIGCNNFFFYLPDHVNLAQVKAVIMMDEEKFLHSTEAYKFRLKIEQFCIKRKIFFYLSNERYFAAYGAILETNIMVKEGEEVAFIHLVASDQRVAVLLVRENDHYRITSADIFLAMGCGDGYWKQAFLGKSKPAKVIIQHVTCDMIRTDDREELYDLFKEYQPIVLTETVEREFMCKAVVEKILQLMDEKQPSLYDIATPCFVEFEVRYGDKLLLKTTVADTLPMEKSFIVDVDPTKTVTYTDVAENPPNVIQETKLMFFKYEKVRVNFKLDLNAFYHFKVEGIFGTETMMPILSAIEKLLNVAKDLEDAGSKKEDVDEPVEEKSHVPEKARFIFVKQNFTVYVYDEKEQQHHVVKDVDGLEKIPIYIAFHEQKPIIGKAAKDIYTLKPQQVVFDLIKLGSISNADVENPKWGFTLSKEDGSIMVTMDTVDGERKSPVDFLLALILKNGNDRIKKEYGKKMKDIEIGFNGFVPNEILKKNFVEAGNLLKINVVFV